MVRKAPWSNQTVLKKEDVPNQNELIGMINNSNETLRNKALVVMAYLTAGRISEIVQEKELRKVFFIKELVNGVKRIKRTKDNVPIVDYIEKIPLNYPGICKKDITRSYLGEDEVMLINMQNRKNRKIKRKNIPVLVKREPQFVEILRDYTKDLGIFEPLFPINKSQAYNIIYNITQMNPHLLRGIRLTHLVTIYGRDGMRLVKFAGWTDSRPAESYIRLDWRDIWR